MGIQEILWTYVQTHPGIVAGNVLLVLAGPAIELLVLPGLYGRLVGCMAPGGDTRLQGRLIGAVVLAVAAVQATQLLRDHLSEYLLPSVQRFLKLEVIDRLLAAGDRSCGPMTAGDTVYLLSVVAEVAQTWLRWLNEYILPYLAILLSAVVAFARFDAPLAGALLAFAAVLIALLVGASRACLPASAEHNQHMTRLHAHVEELIQNADVMRAAGTRSAHLDDLRVRWLPAAYEHYRAAGRCARWYKLWVIPAFALFLVVFLLRSRRLLTDGRVAPRQFVTAFFILTSLMAAVLWVTETMGEAVHDAGHIHSLNAALRDIPGPTHCDRTAPAHPPPPAATALLGMVGVSFGYAGTAMPVLRDVTVGFRRGVRTAIRGGVGTGKSTLLRILLGLCPPDRGEAYLEGRWYPDLGVAYVRRRVGYVPQNAVLFAGTGLANVRYGRGPFGVASE